MSPIVKWTIFGALAGVLVSGSVAAFQLDLPRDYSPEITYCPAGPEALPGGHVVALLESALACAELEIIDDAAAFYISAMARLEADEALEIPSDSVAEFTAFRDLALALEEKLGGHFQELDDDLAAAFSRAYHQVFGWHPEVEHYDPGYPVEAFPSNEEYRQGFRMAVASAYASQILALKTMQEPEFAELSGKLQQMVEGKMSAADSKQLSARMVTLQRDVNERLLENFEPSLIEGRFNRYGVFESLGEIKHIPAPDTADGTRIIPEHTIFHDSSLIVPAELQLAFGFDYEIAGILPGTEDQLMMRAIHPPMRNSVGDLQTVSTTNFDVFIWGGRVEDHLSYRFSESHQLLPGEWTLQIIYFDRVLLSKTFQVIKSDE